MSLAPRGGPPRDARGFRHPARMALTATALVLAAAAPLRAQKTDVLLLYRGDSITGEVKELNRGKLSYKTDDMGTLSVEWDKVAHLTSRNYFDVENRFGARYFGRLDRTGDPGELLVILADTVAVRMIDVVAINRIQANFWSRLDGYVDLGVDFQKANRNRQLNGAGQVRYRGEKWAGQIQGSTYFQEQEGADLTSRNSVSLNARRLFGNHWSSLVIGSLEQNRQLGLDLRKTLGFGATKDFIRTNRMTFLAVAALAFANEVYADDTGSTNTVQLPVGVDFEFFVFDSPKTDLTTDLTVTPVLSDIGRWRIDYNLRVSYELISDFTIGFRFFDTFDNRPPSETAATNDYGLTFSLGYTF